MDITQDPEYIKGYEESMYFQKLDERSKSAHNQGYAAALEFLKAEYMQSDEYKEKEKQGEYKAFSVSNWEDLGYPKREKPMSENIFIRQDQESKEKYERLGLGDIDITSAMLIRSTALGIISEKNITDENEKLQVYQDVKRQRLEYQEQRRKEIEAEYDRKQEQLMLEYKAKQEKETEKQPFKWSEKLEELAGDNKITRLEAKVQELDERLAKLEKYTQE